MANIEDCSSFEIFDTDVRVAWQAKHVLCKAMVERINIGWRYLVNIENDGAIPSLPVVIQFIKACGLPVEHYFDPEIIREEGEPRQRISHRLELCPEEYLPIIEDTTGSAMLIEKPKKNEAKDV